MERTGSPTLAPSPIPISTGSRGVDGMEDLEGSGVLGGVVYAKHGGAACERREVGGESPDQATLHPRAEQVAEQPLARDADQHREPERLAQARGRLERFQILGFVLAEADPRIDEH